MADARWNFWIDRGGTFTDVIGQRPDGALVMLKLLSEDPSRYPDPVAEGILRILDAEGVDPHSGLGQPKIATIRIGTTIATNALLENNGEPTVLVVTRGFGDALWIADQSRPEIFEIDIRRPQPLYTRVVEASERVAANGTVLLPLDQARLSAELRPVLESGVRSAAVVFLHGYEHPEHEQQAAEVARACGFEHVAISSEVNPLIRFVSRGQTTVADACLTPLVRRYFRRHSDQSEASIFFMQSSGGLVSGAKARGKDLVFSGPAGGVVGMVVAGGREGFDRVIGFDMGGTSTDVSVYSQLFARNDETSVRGIKLRAPSLDVHSVASGGGSIVWFDGMRLRVGDQSAGASPGPACYGREGPLTITDCHVLLGRLRPEYFPRVFGPSGDGPLDVAAATGRFESLAAEVSRATGIARTAEGLANDFLRIAVRKMADAVRRLTVNRGLDPSDFALVAFGGAAGQHACAVADELDVSTIIVPPAAGLLSAIGIGMADLRSILSRSVRRPCDSESLDALAPLLRELEEKATESVIDQGAKPSNLSTRCALYLHYEGADTRIPVPLGPADAMAHDFIHAHRMRFGFEMQGRRIMIASVEIEAVGRSDSSPLPTNPYAVWYEAEGLVEHRVWMGDAARSTPFLSRDDLGDDAVSGPAVIVDPDSTIVVESGWTAGLSDSGAVVMRRGVPRRRTVEWTTALDPMRLEIFANLFMNVAVQMGDQLRRTARSVNVKERLDYSCALFDSDGNLVANAPHIPVHLGAMGETVRQILTDHAGRMRPGDAFLSNNPFRGGTHVPDLTVVSPLFVEARGAAEHASPVGFVASRAHHADIGGITSGSMPPAASTLEEEGIVFDGLQIVSDGVFEEETIRSRLGSGRYPARNPDENVGDLLAQIAANQTGTAEFRKAVERYGLDVVRAYMQHIRANAAEATRRAIADLSDGSFAVRMDSGQEIRVSIVVDHAAQRLTIDFAGTSAQRANSLNAPASITTAAVLYVLRCLAGSGMPLNGGCLDPVDIRIPQGSILDPVPPCAVAGGNVETSQCIVDALLGALGREAASQGTMNNLTFGNATRQYYETICGGTGAGPGFDGASAVHSHMTNSRITDPEILEQRLPVLLQVFSIRRGSGGSGQTRGGDGAIRQFQFVQPMDVALLTNRRLVAPHGLAGGLPGSPGSNVLIRTDGEKIDLGPTRSVAVDAGDVLRIETPGGGGYGFSDPTGR